MDIHIITFYTRGGEHDGASSLEHQMLMMMHFSERRGYSFHAYSPEEVISLGRPDLVRRFPEEYRLEKNPGGHSVGLYAWKPFIIKDALSRATDGDVVFYIDCNITKYPGYLDKLDNAKDIVEIALQTSDFFVARESAEQGPRARQFASGAQLRTIGGGSDFCKNFPLLIVNNIVCRKSPTSIEIVDEWLGYCSREELILPPIDGDHDVEFLWMTPEQSALTLLIAGRVERGELPWFYPGVYIGRAYDPRQVEYSHIAYLSHQVALPKRRGGIPSNWIDVELTLKDWVPLIGVDVSICPDGETVVADNEAPDLHLIGASSPPCQGAWVKLTIVARPLPDCDVALCVHHWSGSDVAIFEPDGRVLFDTGAAQASALRLEDGYTAFEVIYPSASSVISVGLARPRGWYTGHGRKQLGIKSIKIQYAPFV